jgi:glutamate synthase domain-containing protein 3
MEPVILSCAELSTREINAALAALPDGASARVLEPRGRHNLAVGLSNRVRIDIEGNAGYFIGGLGDGPDVVVHGFTGWSVGENLQAGSVRVMGNVSECAGASSRGGTIVIEGDASSRAGISLKGGTILVGGKVGARRQGAGRTRRLRSRPAGERHPGGLGPRPLQLRRPKRPEILKDQKR